MHALPPLKALHVFEVAGRHLSFTRAAEELHVTQAAVSHQVKKLEEQLGVKLFRRLNRRLLLTEEGQIYLPAVREGLRHIGHATDQLLAKHRSGVLTVSVLPSFAAKWLVPRLHKFRDQYPDVDVRVSAFEWPVDFSRDEVDLAIRYGRGKWAGLQADPLLTEDVFPVCSPDLVKGARPLRRPADLRHHTLLHDDYSREDWRIWLKAADVKGVDPRRGLSFSHTSIMLEAAESGQGVALGRTPLVADDLARGRLVKPFDISLPADYAYYVVCPVEAADRPKIVAFREWLLAEADATSALFDPARARASDVS